MTYDPNDPRRPVVVELDGMSAGAMAGIAFALLLFLGVMFWAFARRRASDRFNPRYAAGHHRPACPGTGSDADTRTRSGARAEGSVVRS